MKQTILVLFATLTIASAQQYDLLLRGGHVIDPKNKIGAVQDVAILNGRIAKVAGRIDPAQAFKTVDVKGLYVTPGLIDIHTHVYAGTGERKSYAGDNSVYPDGFSFRTGVTTMVDAGGAGWRNFEDFKQRIIDRSQTRVLAFLNIVGHGMRGDKYEADATDMDPEAAAAMARKYKDTIVGIKTAHYPGPEWTPVENAAKAAGSANLPVMVDFGTNRPERPISQLLTKKLRPGDIYTHVYSGLRGEQQADTGHINPALIDGRKRGIIFDVGHGGGSFLWRVAVPLVKGGFWPDSISTDLHIDSMNAGMKDMLNVMSKFLALGLPVDDVIARSTWNPARQINRADLGHLSIGAIADIAVLRIEEGAFGFVDINGARLRGSRKFTCELTLKNGKIAYDLNGLAGEDWETRN
ncbi:MAG TPA: amidohydrolase/deacetylase family metallohydrolase [Bryobacteraceae bacterium]|nr:amidohydrolase/deacetylase family metallohydrolase [Bryobacteraceae bacterium]